MVDGLETRIRNKYGQVRIVFSDPSSLADEKDCSVGSLTVGHDTTERETVEQSLKESEEKFRDIFNSVSDGLIYLSRSGKIVDVNKRATELFGGPRKELLGKHFTKVNIFSLGDVPKLARAFARVLAGKVVTIQVKIKNKKGQERSLECSNYLVKNNGKTVGAVVIARDITARKKAEKALYDLCQFRDRIIDNANVWLDVLDEEIA